MRKDAKTPEGRLRRIWRAMQFRCRYPSHEAFNRYGGRGIQVCQQWSFFAAFETWALANGYAHHLEIDRIDNDGDYEPSNCRWVTRQQQARNKRNNIPPFEVFGEKKTPLQWADDKRCPITYRTLVKRLVAGWQPELAVTTPSQGKGPRPIANRPLGEQHQSAKITEAIVREIRASTRSEREIGLLYGISPALAGLVRRRKAWAHLP